MYPHGRNRLEPTKKTWAIFDGHAYLARDLPRYLLSTRRRMHYVGVGAFVLMIGAYVLDFTLPDWIEWPFLLLIGVSGILLNWTLVARFEHRLARELREHDYLLCTHCGYPLRGSEPHGRCPECGTAYDHDSLRVAWTNLRWAFWKPRV